jgi:hypothetical protein
MVEQSQLSTGQVALSSVLTEVPGTWIVLAGLVVLAFILIFASTFGGFSPAGSLFDGITP